MIRLEVVEGQDEERAVAQHRGEHGDRGRDALQDEVGGRHAEDVTEQERGHVHGEGPRPGDDRHTQRQHPREQQSGPGVLRQPGTGADEGHAADGQRSGDGGTDGQIDPHQGGHGDTGDDPVGQRIAHEGERSQHDPDPDGAAHGRNEQTGDQPSLGEAGREGLEQEVHVRV